MFDHAQAHIITLNDTLWDQFSFSVSESLADLQGESFPDTGDAV